MVLIAFLCFAVLVLAWVAAPGEPVTLGSLLRLDASDAAPGDVEMQH